MSNSSQLRVFRIALKSARQGLGYTLDDLADELAQADDATPVEDLTAWENGKSGPREWDRAAVEAIERTLGAEGTLTEALGWPPA